MIDLIILKDESFQLPVQITTSEAHMLTQMYAGLFLTKRGTFSADLSVGNSIELSQVSSDFLKLYLRKIHDDIIATVPDRFKSIEVTDLVQGPDSLRFTALINGTIPFTVEV